MEAAPEPQATERSSAPPATQTPAPTAAEDERSVFARIGEPVGPTPSARETREPIVDVSTGATLGIDIPGSPAIGPWDPAMGRVTEDDDDDLLRALGNLTPQAARAIAAAAQATTDAERDAALDQAIAANHEPLDRGLLMRFLSSVKQ